MLDWIFILAAVVAGGGGGAPDAQSGEVAAAPGPAFVAEDQTPTGKFTTAAEVAQILDLTRANWIAVREWEGQDLLYFTHLLSWRCGMHQIRYAINGGQMQVFDMPDCHAGSATPNAITAQDGLPYTVHELGSIKIVQVELLLDDLRVLEAGFERAAVAIP